MSAIDWVHLSQPEFDRVVESLFQSENKDLGSDAFAVNGRGGDQGIDISIRRGGRLSILQLKCFPEGFSGGFRDVRQGQIRDSFKAALQHQPYEWWLVVPCTLTLEERKYMDGLAQRNSPLNNRPKVVIFDRPQLDILASAHPDLVTYFKRDELRVAAQDYNAERALMIDRNDVVARVSALAKQSEALSPDWKLEFFTRGDLVGTQLVAKHAQAAEKSPVEISFSAVFGNEHQDLRNSFDRAFSFGTPDRVDLPAAVVSNFVVDGPAFIAGESKNVGLTLWSENEGQEPLPVSLVFQDNEGMAQASFPGKTTWRGAAVRGASLVARFCDAVTLEFLLPFDKTEVVSVTVRIEMAGARPSDIVAGVTLLERLESAEAIVIELDGDQLCRLVANGRGRKLFGDDRSNIFTHRDVAADLLVIEASTDHHFAYPESVDYEDLVYIRILRLLLEGECVVLPEQRQATPKLNGQDGESIRRLLSGTFVSMIYEMENYGQVVLGREVFVGPARIYAPQVFAIDPEPILAALDAGAAEGRDLTIGARDGYGFWIFLPERYERVEDDRLVPVTLGIEGFTDAPDVARARETASDRTQRSG